jgi:hypothetical protein
LWKNIVNTMLGKHSGTRLGEKIAHPMEAVVEAGRLQEVEALAGAVKKVGRGVGGGLVDDALEGVAPRLHA